LNFVTHQNFPDKYLNLLLVYDGENTIERAQGGRYPTDTPEDEWIECVGKERPTVAILNIDDGMLTNPIRRHALRESGCVFVYLSSGWSKTRWQDAAHQLLKCWLKVVEEAKNTVGPAALEISPRGKIRRINL